MRNLDARAKQFKQFYIESVSESQFDLRPLLENKEAGSAWGAMRPGHVTYSRGVGRTLAFSFLKIECVFKIQGTVTKMFKVS